MSETTRMFALGDILSITSGALVSRDHMDGVYRILNFMTGDDLFTHQLPRASDECRPALSAQHPQLVGVDLPDGLLDGLVEQEARSAAIYRWLGEQEQRFGRELPITALTSDDHTGIDPIAELRMLRPDIEPLVVDLDGVADQ